MRMQRRCVARPALPHQSGTDRAQTNYASRKFPRSPSIAGDCPSVQTNRFYAVLWRKRHRAGTHGRRLKWLRKGAELRQTGYQTRMVRGVEFLRLQATRCNPVRLPLCGGRHRLLLALWLASHEGASRAGTNLHNRPHRGALGAAVPMALLASAMRACVRGGAASIRSPVDDGTSQPSKCRPSDKLGYMETMRHL